jgi:hypothetical protein
MNIGLETWLEDEEPVEREDVKKGVARLTEFWVREGLWRMVLGDPDRKRRTMVGLDGAVQRNRGRHSCG